MMEHLLKKKIDMELNGMIFTDEMKKVSMLYIYGNADEYGMVDETVTDYNEKTADFFTKTILTVILKAV